MELELELEEGGCGLIGTFGAEDHVPGLAGGVVAGEAGVEEAAADVGLLGPVLVGHHPFVLLLRDLGRLHRRRWLRRHRSVRRRHPQPPAAIAEPGRAGQEVAGASAIDRRRGGWRGRQRGGQRGGHVWVLWEWRLGGWRLDWVGEITRERRGEEEDWVEENRGEEQVVYDPSSDSWADGGLLFNGPKVDFKPVKKNLGPSLRPRPSAHASCFSLKRVLTFIMRVNSAIYH